MTLKNVIGIDHAVVMVRDLDQAAANWRRLGFTISPRGTHSAKMGSGNYTIMLDPDYIELLGVLAETEHNAPARAFLAGVERALALAEADGDAVGLIAHGTTVATNAIIENKGARAALITTEGFRYVLDLGRHDIPRSENLYRRIARLDGALFGEAPSAAPAVHVQQDALAQAFGAPS